MGKLIEIKNMTAAYGKKQVLRDVSLTVWENDFLGIIGSDTRSFTTEGG